MTKWKKGDFLGTTIKVNDICKKRRESRFLLTLVCRSVGPFFLLEVVGELLGNFRIVTGELLVAVFGVDVFCNRDRRLLGVEDKRSLSFGGESRVVTEQSPVTGIHGHLLVLKLAVEIETVVDAGAVADDQRRTTVSWRRQLSSCRRRREHKSVALSLLQLTCAVV